MLNLNCRGRLLAREHACVMGILNATPDSFYTKGRQNTVAEHIAKAGEMLEQGATIIDIGGMSTRPGAEVISVQEELDRVTPVVEGIRNHFPEAFLSIDTYRAAVAQAAVQAGADIVNDVSAGDMDAAMLHTVATLQVPYIAMHMKGTPQNMQHKPEYDNVAAEISDYFRQKLIQCASAGICDIILDPGFGFGKTTTHNYQLLKDLHVLHMLGKPVLAGLSRKGMVYKPLNTDAEHALNGTTALHMLALQEGSAILRAHDVKEAVECITLFHYYQTI